MSAAGVAATVAVWRRGEPPYPIALATIKGPPRQLYALGDAATLAVPCVAVVGTRRPTPYGERTARALAAALARAGVCVVSGMAYGIDGAAHRAALEAGGRTAAVLGAGVDTPYPRSHRALHRDIAECGVVVSEFPPGAPAFPGCFPRRNRIIAGLAAATIVVEAGERSGALITAGCALEAGRPVAAVPGQIDSPQSAGTNQLLRDGAHVIAAPEDALVVAGLGAGGNGGVHPAAAAEPLGPDEDAVWQAVLAGHASVDAVVTATALPPPRCLAAITGLELRGLALCTAAGEIRRFR